MSLASASWAMNFQPEDLRFSFVLERLAGGASSSEESTTVDLRFFFGSTTTGTALARGTSTTDESESSESEPRSESDSLLERDSVLLLSSSELDASNSRSLRVRALNVPFLTRMDFERRLTSMSVSALILGAERLASARISLQSTSKDGAKTIHAFSNWSKASVHANRPAGESMGCRKPCFKDKRTCPAVFLAKLVEDLVRAVFVVVITDHEGVESELLHDVSELGRKIVLPHVRDGRVEVRRSVLERPKVFAILLAVWHWIDGGVFSDGRRSTKSRFV